MKASGRARKGARGEVEWVAFLRAHGVHAWRSGDAQRRGLRVPDVEDVAGFSWEVKRRERGFVPVYRALDQAALVLGRVPAVAFRMNGRPWVVALLAEDFVRLLVERERSSE